MSGFDNRVMHARLKMLVGKFFCGILPQILDITDHDKFMGYHSIENLAMQIKT
jgi:hypothetical protein